MTSFIANHRSVKVKNVNLEYDSIFMIEYQPASETPSSNL